MKIYLASSFDLAARCENLRLTLEKAGHSIPDVWWNVKTKDDFTDSSDETFYDSPIVKSIATRHWKTINECDAVVLVSGAVQRTFTGANVEVGYAIGTGKPVLSLGIIKRSAMYCPITRCMTTTELLACLDIIGGIPR